ncbi:MAG TPA: cation:proton antiporter [Candidatus Limnocylindrales bacterium]|nr:cation:proton antiporter [Candidatus Limnocylindrales bacterium]
MDHEPVLISTIAIGLTAAFIGGLAARRLGLPPIVGYILAGVAIGPFTPGLVADPAIATELAELGVILLMFGVGIHFSIHDLMAVRSIAIPGALIQTAVAVALGVALGSALGWGLGGGLVLGLALSIASTVVVLRALGDRQEQDTIQGQIAVGWLIVEDLLAVLVLVLLPSIAPIVEGQVDVASAGQAAIVAIAIALGKAAVFAILMIVAGARLVPWLMLVVAREGSRELFSLAVLAIALGLAFVSSSVFGVSFALGAFLAGAVVSESDMSHQAAADALPLRDAFAVLFFVSVGMLLDPSYLIANPLPIAAVIALIVVGKWITKVLIVGAAGYPPRVALTVAAGLAQIGEFSFIIGTLGRSLGLLPDAGYQLIVAGALISIAINPVLFAVMRPIEGRLRASPTFTALMERRAGELGRITPDEQAALRVHAIVCGYGRVGRLLGPAFERRGFRYVVITQQRDEVDRLRAGGVTAIYGDAANPVVLEMAGIASARLVVVATSDPHETRLIVERVRELNAGVDLVVRTHSDTEAAHLRSLGGKVQAVHGERELAVQMARYALRRFGISATEAEAIAQGLRGRPVALAQAARRPLLADLVGRLRGGSSGPPA